jgi:uncharacterized protein (TIGR02145 family)
MKKLAYLIVLVFLVNGSCKKDPTLAVLTTSAVKDITVNSVTSGGNITNGGGAEISERGVCWSTSQKPLISGSHSSDGKGTGSFTSLANGLIPNTKYYLRAYATNSAGTAYGNEVSTTTMELVAPTPSTVAVTDINFSSATSGGSITSDGNDPITAKGVCWSTSSNPTTSDSKTSDGSGSASFTSFLTELTPGTTYHVRAYATNSVGTGYGNEVTFATTALAVPVLTTEDPGSITFTTAVSGGTITSGGGSDVTEKGVCWSTSQNPTITDTRTTDGSGTGSYTSNLTGLAPGTIYHIRSYATNSVGTGYGNDLTFTTTAISLATITTRAVTAVTYTTAASGGDISDTGGGSITAKGVCWSVNPNPTVTDSHSSNGTGSDNYASNLASLTQNTTYHVRAYATNSAGTAYGNDLVFTTLAVSLPTLTTIDITLITSTTAHSGGNITSAGGGNILGRGICWSVSAEPTIAGSHTSDGTGAGAFPSNMTGLSSETLYHARAYATNEAGTTYGNELTFTTLIVTLPTVTTTAVTSVTGTSASTGGNVTDAGNGTISARGVCWGITTGPTITGNHTNDGTGTGSFTSSLTGLAGSTTYYVRAYATNSAGTSYGSETTFATLAATDADGNNYTAVVIGTQTWLVENLKTTRYTNGDPIGTTVPMNLDITAEISPEYQWPAGGSENFVATYGRFYTFTTVTDSRGICPTGWHVPNDSEWETMKAFLGGDAVAGGKVKESGTAHWNSPNTGAEGPNGNESGFTALPAGYRSVAGDFVSLQVTGYFWSTTPNPTPGMAWGQGLHYNDAILLRGGYYNNDGVPVRCVKN